MASASPAPVRVRFGLYELDPALWELRRNGTLISLQRQPCRLLYLLAMRGGAIVSREEIRGVLWPDERAGEFDVRINFCLARIREALEDEAANPRFVRTVRGQGYCFLAPLLREEVAGPAAVRVPEAEAALSVAAAPTRRWRWAGAAAGLVVVAGAGVVLWARRGATKPANDFQLGAAVTVVSSPEPIIAVAAGGGKAFVTVVTPQGPRLASVPEGGGSLTLLPVAGEISQIDAVSGDGRYLATRRYEGTPNGATAYIVRADGSGAPQLLDSIVQAAAWRPDAEELAYASGNRVWVAGPVGGAKRVLATVPEIVTGLAWSSDGRQLVIACQDTAQESSFLWLLDVNTVEPVRLAKLPGLGQIDKMIWTRSGDFVVMRADRRQFSDSVLVVLPLRRHGSGVTAGDAKILRIYSGPGFQGPALDSQGRILVSDRVNWTGTLRFQRGSGQWQPLLANAQDVAYAPDGRRMAYVQPSDNTLWLRDGEGGPARKLTGLHALLPSWSPDGKLLAFTALAPGANWRLYLMGTDGGRPEALPDPDAANGQGAPRWLPDGQALIYADTWCGHPQDCGVHRLDLRTRQVTLLPGSVGLRTARVSPDGRWVAALEAVTHNIMLRRLDGTGGDGGGWRRLWPHTLSDSLAWSSDSRFLYGVEVSGGEAAIERVGLDGSGTAVARFHDPTPADADPFPGFGLGPGDSLLLAHYTPGSEVVAAGWRGR
jgi:Tol biopolymer transport system component/DNA-binding winged helix-turn-helix (wHTH) protein